MKYLHTDFEIRDYRPFAGCFVFHVKRFITTNLKLSLHPSTTNVKVYFNKPREKSVQHKYAPARPGRGINYDIIENKTEYPASNPFDRRYLSS